MTPITPRPEVRATPPDHHGALDFAELERLGIDPDDVLDFSVNSSPFGPPPGVREAIAAAPVDRYPDRDALALRRALAARHGVAVDQIVAGNGSAELLWLAAFCFLDRGDSALIAGPTFGEYARAARLAGADVAEVRADPAGDFAPPVEAMARALSDVRPRVAFICNPNNPTGAVLAGDVLSAWAAGNPETLFVVDEAYVGFVPGMESALKLGAPNALVLRSMTKDYALAGLRLGYAAGDPAIVGAIARARSPWNVSGPAQAAGLAALGSDAAVSTSLAELLSAKAALIDGLRACGLRPLPSRTHYFLVEVGDGASFRRRLLGKNVMVRDCASFGIPTCVRIAARRPAENQRLLAAIREVMP